MPSTRAAVNQPIAEEITRTNKNHQNFLKTFQLAKMQKGHDMAWTLLFVKTQTNAIAKDLANEINTKLNSANFLFRSGTIYSPTQLAVVPLTALSCKLCQRKASQKGIKVKHLTWLSVKLTSE
jgi:hypothetical protein